METHGSRFPDQHHFYLTVCHRTEVCPFPSCHMALGFCMPGNLKTGQQTQIKSPALSNHALLRLPWLHQHLLWRQQQPHDLARRWIHYAWRHWNQIKHLPGVSWHRIAASYTMMHIDHELTCKVALHPLLPVLGCILTSHKAPAL